MALGTVLLVVGGIGGRGGGFARYCSNNDDDAKDGGDWGADNGGGWGTGNDDGAAAACAVVVGGAAAVGVGAVVVGGAAAPAPAPADAARSAAFCLRNASSCVVVGCETIGPRVVVIVVGCDPCYLATPSLCKILSSGLCFSGRHCVLVRKGSKPKYKASLIEQGC